MQSEKIVCTYKDTEIDCLYPQYLITPSIKYLSVPYLKFHITVRLRAVSLFSVVCRAKRETRKWPRAWLMARDGRGTKKLFSSSRAAAFVSHVSRLVPNLTCCDTPLEVSFLVCLFGSSPATIEKRGNFFFFLIKPVLLLTCMSVN